MICRRLIPRMSLRHLKIIIYIFLAIRYRRHNQQNNQEKNVNNQIKEESKIASRPDCTAKKPLSKQMRTPPDISVRNLWDDYVAQNNAAKQLSYPRMISYREILRLSHKVYSQHQLESSLHCLQCMIREVLTAAGSKN